MCVCVSVLFLTAADLEKTLYRTLDYLTGKRMTYSMRQVLLLAADGSPAPTQPAAVAVSSASSVAVPAAVRAAPPIFPSLPASSYVSVTPSPDAPSRQPEGAPAAPDAVVALDTDAVAVAAIAEPDSGPPGELLPPKEEGEDDDDDYSPAVAVAGEVEEGIVVDIPHGQLPVLAHGPPAPPAPTAFDVAPSETAFAGPARLPPPPRDADMSSYALMRKVLADAARIPRAASKSNKPQPGDLYDE